MTQFFLIRSWMIFFLISTGCGTSTSVSPSLIIQIKGLDEVQGASGPGDAVPKSYELTLNSIKMTTSDGTDISVFSTGPTKVSVVNREQIVFQKTLDAAWQSKTYQSMTLSFDPSVTIVGATQKHVMTLDQTDWVVPTFTIGLKKSQTIYVNIAWKNSVTSGANESAVLGTITYGQ